MDARRAIRLLALLVALTTIAAGPLGLPVADAQSTPHVFRTGTGEAPPPPPNAYREIGRARPIAENGGQLVDEFFVDPASNDPGPGNLMHAEVRGVEAELFDGQCVAVTSVFGHATMPIGTDEQGNRLTPTRAVLAYGGNVLGPDGSNFGSLSLSAIPDDGGYGPVAGDGTYMVRATLTVGDATYALANGGDATGRVGFYQLGSTAPSDQVVHACPTTPTSTTMPTELPRTT